MLTFAPIEGILLGDEREGDFLLLKTRAQSKVEKHIRFSLIPEMRPFLLEANMPVPLGFKHSEETKKKIGDSNRGQKRSVDIRKKMSIAQLGNKSGRGNKGRKQTDEHKNKIAKTRNVFSLAENNPNWKGGRAFHSKGYVWIQSHVHPFRDIRGYILEHRLVVEKQIGRYLLPKEKVHHLGRKDDNRPQMLMAFVNQAEHLRFEHGIVVKPEDIIFDGREQCVS